MRGEVLLSDEDGQLFLRPASKEDRLFFANAIRSLVPSARLRADGNDLVLSMQAAVALRHEGNRSSVHWSDEAAAFTDTFAAGIATRGHALRRLQQLDNLRAAELALKDYAARDVLDEHQRIAVAAMTDSFIDGLCLFDEQGSGKTVMTIHAFDRLTQLGRASKLLIFAPKNMLPTWKDDFGRFMGTKYKVEVVAGGRKSKFAALLSPADVYVTNYETAQTLESELRSLVRRSPGQVAMTVDESFFVKNASAIRSSAIRRLRPFCSRCWVLCGTPAPNGAIDVVNQFNIADGGVTFASVDLPRDPGELHRTVQNVVQNRGLFLRRLKQDVLPDLPPKFYESVSVDMEPVQRGLYEETLTGLIEDVVAADERGFRDLYPSFLARRMALLQIASNPRLVFPEYSDIPPKQKAIDVLLDRHIKHDGEKVVLWSYFRGSLDDLESRFSKYGAVRLDGSVVTMSERADAVRRFQNDPAINLFIANPAAAGAGITLTTSRIAIYESFPTQAAHFLQSVDRIHRRGQNRNTHYYFLLSRNSLEEDEYQRLLAKDRMGFELFGDEPPELRSRDVFLNELQSALKRLTG